MEFIIEIQTINLKNKDLIDLIRRSNGIGRIIDSTTSQPRVLKDVMTTDIINSVFHIDSIKCKNNTIYMKVKTANKFNDILKNRKTFIKNYRVYPVMLGRRNERGVPIPESCKLYKFSIMRNYNNIIPTIISDFIYENEMDEILLPRLDLS